MSSDYDYAILEAVYSASMIRQLQEFNLRYIDQDDLYYSNEVDGREMNSHITLLYGIREHRPNVPKIQQVLQNHPALNFVDWLGLTKFEAEDYDVLIIEVKSEVAETLHHDFCNLYPDNADSHPVYQPHTTLAYLKKGLADKYIKKYGTAFQEMQVPIKWIRFDYNGNPVNFFPATGDLHS